MNGRIVMLVAALGLVAGTGCHVKKESRSAKAEKQSRVERLGHDTEETAEKAAEDTSVAAEKAWDDTKEATRKAADDTLKETERAEERVFGEGETLPPEPGRDMPDMDENTPKPDETVAKAGDKAEKNIDKAAEKIDETSDDAEAKIDEKSDELERTADAMDGKFVAAKVDTINRMDERVRFRIEEDLDEIQLQSGREIDVPFSDLTLFTGHSKKELLEKLQTGADVRVKVIGAGEAMRIVDVEMHDEK